MPEYAALFSVYFALTSPNISHLPSVELEAADAKTPHHSLPSNTSIKLPKTPGSGSPRVSNRSGLDLGGHEATGEAEVVASPFSVTSTNYTVTAIERRLSEFSAEKAAVVDDGMGEIREEEEEEEEEFEVKESDTSLKDKTE